MEVSETYQDFFYYLFDLFLFYLLFVFLNEPLQIVFTELKDNQQLALNSLIMNFPNPKCLKFYLIIFGCEPIDFSRLI